MNEKITKRSIDSMIYAVAGGKKDIRWDSEMSGFGIRVYPSGKKSFVLIYRQSGTQRLYTIGQYGNITLEQARDLARKKFGEIADGKDPFIMGKNHKKKHQWTVNKAFKDFLKKYNHTGDRHRDEVERIFEKDVLPAIGKKPIDEVKKDDIIKILDTVLERGSRVMANRTHTRLSRFFGWCIERDLVEHSPVYKISKPSREKSRDRILNDAEIKEIWMACDTVGYPFGPLVQFLILTGQRRGEAAAMQWGDYDEDKKLWTQPRENTKSDRQHQVHLTAAAIKILDTVPNMGDYIFTSSGERPFENFSRDKKDLDIKLKKDRSKDSQPPMLGWTVHDLRRTCASGMARLGVAPHIVERILSHTSGTIRGVAAVYNRYEYADEMRDALGLWAAHIQETLEATDLQKSVIRIPKKTRV